MRDAVRRLVDEAGARLRVLTAETQPKVQARLRQLRERRGWMDAAGEEKAAAILTDGRTVELDNKSAQLLARIDELAEDGTSEKVDCSRIGELEAASLELQATVRAKSQHMLARLDQEIETDAAAKPTTPTGPASAAPPASVASAAPPLPPVIQRREGSDAEPQLSLKPTVSAQPERAEPGRPPGPVASAPPAARPPPPPAVKAPPPSRKADAQPVVRPPQAKPEARTDWTTETVARPPTPAPVVTEKPAGPPRPQPAMPAVDPAPAKSFSRDEIAQASQGFFGTISGGLASVIEHAFSTLGQPTSYVLGSEGGGALIAGVRYGKGTLFMRDGTRRELYWHGPSIGYDVGASGSKTLFLVYNLSQDIDIFSGYTGIDGSAYLVGGVGMTILTDGKVVMAPIRSGLGVRLGANIGYVRFTARPTWNPF